jgi:hypothetical protein
MRKGFMVALAVAVAVFLATPVYAATLVVDDDGLGSVVPLRPAQFKPQSVQQATATQSLSAPAPITKTSRYSPTT